MIDARAVWTLFVALALASANSAAADEASAVTLMRNHKCYLCHADNETVAGPAFADVAASYRGNREAVPIIAKRIRSGARGAGPWHMPPHPEISAEEAARMARYIVSLDRGSPLPRGGGASSSNVRSDN